jgi:hypothetical protein
MGQKHSMLVSEGSSTPSRRSLPVYEILEVLDAEENACPARCDGMHRFQLESNNWPYMMTLAMGLTNREPAIRLENSDEAIVGMMHTALYYFISPHVAARRKVGVIHILGAYLCPRSIAGKNEMV